MSVARQPFVRWKSCSPGRVATLVGVLFFAGLFAGSASVQVPRGVFSLVAAGKPAAQSTLDNPDVAGVSIRQDWADLEPSEGSFNWSFLDSEVAKAAAAGKDVLLRIRTQDGKPAWVTAAVQQAGGLFFNFDDDGVPTSIPVFWDPTFLAKKKAMITALGGHFTNSPAVKIVSCELCQRHQRRLECAAHRCRSLELVRRRLHNGEAIGCREADHRHHDVRLSQPVCDARHRRQRSCRWHRQP